jgi:NAD(P)H-hydrate repair Nnr-like enzyme with NAD(P)H-hydrate dehydratase domain
LRSGAGIEDGSDGDIGSDDAARAAAAKDAAAAWSQVVVLKGARTVIAEPDGTVTVVPFENPALASGGTGDVLAGIIGGLLAQGLAPGPAARLGAYLHGLAGEMVRERIGDAGLLASDLPDLVPIVRKRLAAIAERSASGKRLGFGSREPDGKQVEPEGRPV